MSNLIPINYDNDRQTVSGRILHDFLGVETRYNDWFPRMCEYGFAEGVDFYSILSKTQEGGRPSTDHQLTIEMAKEISMLARTEKGRQARQYFIQVEKKYKQQSIDTSQLSPQMQLLTQMVKSMAQQELIVKQAEQMALEAKTGLEQARETLNAIKETVITNPDNWREEINRMLNKIAQAIGQDKYREIRSESYKTLEHRAGVNLERRLLNLRTRLLDQGKSKTDISKANKLDCIAEDRKLREIYAAIIKEYTIKYVA